jgi:hypothetical protein
MEGHEFWRGFPSSKPALTSAEGDECSGHPSISKTKDNVDQCWYLSSKM